MKSSVLCLIFTLYVPVTVETYIFVLKQAVNISL